MIASGFLQKSAAVEMGRSGGLNVVIFQHADGAIDFEYGARSLFVSGDSMLTQRPLQFVHGDMLFGHVRFDDRSFVNERTGLSLNIFSKTAIPS
jgi:hypothetical protein